MVKLFKKDLKLRKRSYICSVFLKRKVLRWWSYGFIGVFVKNLD